MLRSIADTDSKLGMMTRRRGWKYRVYARLLMTVGIVKTILLPIYSRKATDAFAFYAINRGDIRNIDQKKMLNGQVELTFYKKKSFV